MNFQPKENTGLSHIEGEAETLQKPGVPGVDPDMIQVQCFPLYSVLLAVGRTKVDFFSLDVEGHELKVLKTIPWHKVDIKVIREHKERKIIITQAFLYGFLNGFN